MTTCFDFLRGYLLIGCIFNIGLAVGAIISGIFLDKLIEEFLIYDSAQQVKFYVVIGFYALGSICALTGLLGVFAFWKKIKCFQTLFIIFNMLFFILYASIFIGLMIAQPHLNILKNSECENISQLQSANNLFVNKFKPKFCKKGSELNNICGCHFPDPSKWTAEQLSKLEQKPQGQNTVKNILECKQSDIQDELKSKDTEISLLKAIEEEFNCTGVCQGDIIFYFSDLTRGPPGNESGCFKPFRDFLLKIIGDIFIYVVIATVFTFLNVTIGFVNCCCDRQQDENENKNKNDKDKDKNGFEMSYHIPLNTQRETTRNFNQLNQHV